MVKTDYLNPIRAWQCTLLREWREATGSDSGKADVRKAGSVLSDCGLRKGSLPLPASSMRTRDEKCTPVCVSV